MGAELAQPMTVDDVVTRRSQHESSAKCRDLVRRDVVRQNGVGANASWIAPAVEKRSYGGRDRSAGTSQCDERRTAEGAQQRCECVGGILFHRTRVRLRLAEQGACSPR